MYGIIRAIAAMMIGFVAVVAFAHAFSGSPALRVTELRQAAARAAQQPIVSSEPRPVPGALVFSTVKGTPVIVCIHDGGAGQAAVVRDPSRPPRCADGQLKR